MILAQRRALTQLNQNVQVNSLSFLFFPFQNDVAKKTFCFCTRSMISVQNKKKMIH